MADKLSQEEAERLAREADAHDAAAAANFNISKGGEARVAQRARPTAPQKRLPSKPGRPS